MTRTELIAAVLADPDAAWAVLTAEIKVAGPWERVDLSAGPVYRRMFPQKRGPAVSYYERDGTVFVSVDWPEPFPGTLAEAKTWCDARLKANGWLLASETP